MNNIEKLLEELSNHGVCETGKRWLRGQKKDMETLIHVWRRWPEYLQEHHDFVHGVMKGLLSEGDLMHLEKERLYVDRKNVILNGIKFPHEPIFLIGDSNVELNFEDFGTAIIYCFGNSKLKVNGDETVILNIKLFNNSKLFVNGNVIPNVVLCDNAVVEGDAKTRIRELKRGSVFNGEERQEYKERNW